MNVGHGSAHRIAKPCGCQYEWLRAALDLKVDRPNPDTLQDVLTREWGATSLSPEQPETATATSVRGGRV